jgi:predicted Zn-dependent protease
MDEGRYAAAEKSYRKANYLDPDFLIGQSVYARLILDTDERIKIYKHVEAEKSRVEGDERMLLEVYQSLVYYTNLREQKSTEAPNALWTALKTAEKNLGYLVSKYPEEIYLKSEYIEILHANYGAARALDSLEELTSGKQKQNPFLMGYAASMEAELGNFDIALDKANALAKFFKGIRVPKPDAVYADVYYKKKELEKAYFHADNAYRLDNRNLDASRLRDKIKAEIQQRKDTMLIRKSY